MIELERECVLVLMRQVSEYMWREVNLGGNEGCQMSSEKSIKKLKVVMNLLLILVRTNLTVLTSINNNNINNDLIYNSMDWLIKWYIFNSVDNSTELSPSIHLMKRISKLVLGFFNKIRKDPLICKLALRSLISIYQ
jgi:hypothetical protein